MCCVLENKAIFECCRDCLVFVTGSTYCVHNVVLIRCYYNRNNRQREDGKYKGYKEILNDVAINNFHEDYLWDV